MVKEKFLWTSHSQQKMMYYRLSLQMIKRVIRYPTRLEVGVIENGIAVMRPSLSKKYSEIWVMYIIVNPQQLKIITVWRYPGKSQVNDPIPREVLQDIRSML